MKLTKSQLKQTIKEELQEGGYAGHYTGEEDDPDGVLARFNHREKVLKSIQALDFLKMKARDYHDDPTLNSGDIKALLQDDFMDSPYPKFFGMDEGEPSIAEFIEQFAVGQELNEGNKMKITKAKLKQIIKEELEAVVETAQFDGGPEVDIQDAIQMLEAEEDTTGTLHHVINRLEQALEKLGGDDDYDDSMDGDFDSAMASAGYGTDEDYGHYGDDY